MKINKEFWQTVLKEFNNSSPHEEFLCRMSESFRSAWGDTEKRKIIRRHFENWMNHSRHPLVKMYKFSESSNILFESGEITTGRRKVLKEFLEWISNKNMDSISTSNTGKAIILSTMTNFRPGKYVAIFKSSQHVMGDLYSFKAETKSAAVFTNSRGHTTVFDKSQYTFEFAME